MPLKILEQTSPQERTCSAPWSHDSSILRTQLAWKMESLGTTHTWPAISWGWGTADKMQASEKTGAFLLCFALQERLLIYETTLWSVQLQVWWLHLQLLRSTMRVPVGKEKSLRRNTLSCILINNLNYPAMAYVTEISMVSHKKGKYKYTAL